MPRCTHSRKTRAAGRLELFAGPRFLRPAICHQAAKEARARKLAGKGTGRDG